MAQEPTKKRIDIERVVDRIVDDLFINGMGQKAKRLVLTSESGADLGGWCRAAMRDRILNALKRASHV